MKKYSDWNETLSYDGEVSTIKSGGYICRILGMREEKSKNGSDMIVMAFDIAEGDFADYYTKRFNDEKKTKPEAKFKGTYYILPKKADGSTNPYWKGLISCIEKSNNITLPDEFDDSLLKGKLFGGLFRKEEFEENKWVTKLSAIRTVDKIKSGDFEVPADKALPKTIFSINNDISDEDLPF